MPYRTMSLEDFAKHVGMDARDVRRLADRGKLPAQKVGGNWRFSRARVTEWLQQEMSQLDERRLVEVERAMSAGLEGGTIEDTTFVTDLIGPEGVDLALPANTRASLLRELVRLAERTQLLYDAQGLHFALEERESLCSTALPNGVAIPHPRQPMPYVSAEPFICVARVPKGIGFGSPDRRLTHLFVLICCHDDRHHLRVLARLMRILDGDTIDRALEAEEVEELLAMLIEKELGVITRTGKLSSPG